jgi:TonB family protein
MASVAPPPVEDDLQLLTLWGSPGDSARMRNAGLLSIAVHVVAIVALGLIPPDVIEPYQPPIEHVTALYIPADLTQRAPNKGKLSKEFNAADSAPRPNIQIPTGAPSTTRARAFRLDQTPEAPPVKATAPLPEAPKVDQAPVKTELPQIAQVTPQIQAVEQPKLSLENPAALPAATTKGQSRVAVPNASVAPRVQLPAPGKTAGGLTIGDLQLGGPGGIGAGANLPPSPGLTGSALELKSDPQGVDFRDYLLQIYQAVKNNWMARNRDLVRTGRRGRVSIQFAIDRSGSVATNGLRIVSSSGTQILDITAVAGISGAIPFPALPAAYKGDRIVVQFNFAYNMPKE